MKKKVPWYSMSITFTKHARRSGMHGARFQDGFAVFGEEGGVRKGHFRDKRLI